MKGPHTVREAANALRVSSDTVYGLLWKGQLKGFRVGLGRGAWRIEQKAIDDYIKANTGGNS